MTLLKTCFVVVVDFNAFERRETRTQYDDDLHENSGFFYVSLGMFHFSYFALFVPYLVVRGVFLFKDFRSSGDFLFVFNVTG